VSTEKLNLSNSLAIRILVLPLFLCLAIVTGACSPIRSIFYDYNRAIDFSGLRTYDWIPIPTEMQKKEALMLKRIKKAVNSRLEAKGFKITKGESDFLIATNFGQREKLRLHDWGYPHYRRHRRYDYYDIGPYYGGRVTSFYYREGALFLDFIDTGSKEVIWKGVATVYLSKDLTPEKIDKIVDEAVEKILVNFPPATTE
jgi:hypothetical protein